MVPTKEIHKYVLYCIGLWLKQIMFNLQHSSHKILTLIYVSTVQCLLNE